MNIELDEAVIHAKVREAVNNLLNDRYYWERVAKLVCAKTDAVLDEALPAIVEEVARDYVRTKRFRDKVLSVVEGIAKQAAKKAATPILGKVLTEDDED